MKLFSSKRAILFYSCLVLILHVASAQSFLLKHERDFFAIEFAKPDIDGSSGINFFTGAYDVSFSTSLSEQFVFLGDLPIAHFSADDLDNETGFGNIYLGGRGYFKDNMLSLDFGVYLPSASKDKSFASAFGFLGHLNRMELYLPDIWALTASMKVNETFANDKGFYRFNAGMTYIKPKDSDIGTDIYFLDYSAQIGYRTPDNLMFVASFSGRSGLTEESEIDEDDATALFGGLGISYRSKQFEPGLEYKFPLDKPYKDVVNNIFSVVLLCHF